LIVFICVFFCFSAKASNISTKFGFDFGGERFMSGFADALGVTGATDMIIVADPDVVPLDG